MRRTRQGLFKGMLVALSATAGVLLFACLFWGGNSEAQTTRTATTETPLLAQRVPVDTSILTVPISASEIEDTHQLELINGMHPISQEPGFRQLKVAYSAVAVSNESIRLQENALTAVADMFAAAQRAGIHSLYVSSGYRDYVQQKELYKETLDKSTVQKPGHSEHQTGLAADIFAQDQTNREMMSSFEGQWLAKNSWEYGLIVRYQEGKQDVTGISYEPWHVRYVGQPHAWFCYQNNLCFEEYIQYLKDTGGYQATLNGTDYAVFYQTAANGVLYVPDGLGYTVSSDNTGGFIVTVCV